MGTVQGLQQKPARGTDAPPPILQAGSKKRAASRGEDSPRSPAKRRKSGQQGGHGISPTAKAVEFRPANRAPPTEEDLELTRPVRRAKPDAQDEERVQAEKDDEFDPPSPTVTTSKRVSELRGDGTKRSSRTRHLEKVARRSEYGLRSGLRKEWSME